MKLRALEVANFGSVESASVRFDDGLNVLYGPNDLGKSTLAASIRAALLLQHGSSAARPFIPWGTPRKPEVTLTFEVKGRTWRVHKTFGSSSGGKSMLAWSNDGQNFTPSEEGRAVDGELRRLLGWGLAAPGGRGGSHGFPKSFLSTVLLGEQALPYRVLGQGLDDDPDESGKARLIEALQAMATDPLYQHVLDTAQKRVEEAFTATGKRSSRKGSPFERASTEIRARRESSESLAQQVADSESVVSRLAELNEARDRALAARADAQQRHQDLESACALAQQRATLQAELDDAQRALEAIEHNRRAIAQLDEELRDARARLPKVDAAVEQAAGEGRDARALLQRARDELEALERGDDPKAQREVQDLRETIRVRQDEVATLERAQQSWTIETGKREVASQAAEALEHARLQVEQARAAQQEANAKVQHARDAHLGLLDAKRWAHLNALQRQAEQRAALEKDAASKLAAADDLRDGLSEPFPTQEVRAAMRTAWSELREREAALGGGLRASWEGASSIAVEVDGEAAQALAPQGALDAQRELVVQIEGGGALKVVAGKPDDHAAAERARTAWQPHAQTLEALQLASLEALEAEARRRETLETQAQNLVRQAELLRARAGDEDLGTALQVAQRAVENVDEAACNTLIERYGDALDTQVDEADAELGSAERAAHRVGERSQTAATELRMAEGAQEVAARDLEAFVSLKDTKGLSVAQIERQMVEAHDALERATAALRDIDASQAARQLEVKARVQDVAGRVERAQAAEATARAEHGDVNAAITAASAQLAVRREQSSEHNPMLAAERIARAHDALSGHPQAPPVDEEDRQAAVQALHAATEALEEAETAVRQQEGALQHVGGQVVRERALMAREALEDAQRSQAEVALDYDGWRLLLDTLREVENETGAHLGRALGGTIAERISALTSGRYAGASLGADLQAEGVLTSHGLKGLDRFSEGVKEQFATVMRVAVAEQLQTMLLLDDHLAQTDPQRARWFRDALRTTAKNIQIVVLTCRPHEYLHDTPDGVHAVDLADVVQRRP